MENVTGHNARIALNQRDAMTLEAVAAYEEIERRDNLVALADFDRQPCNRYALAGESTHIPDWPRNRDITERRAALLGISQEVIERTGHSALMTLVALAERKLRA